jgi:uncharacterized membrane protein YczE
MNNLIFFMKKLSIFLLGLYLMSIGVVFSVNANLGVSPISCVPYIYDLASPLTLGQTTIILNIMLIFLQIILLRKAYKPFQLIQFPIVFLFGLFIDMNVRVFHGMVAHDYPTELLLCLLSCLILGFGVFLEVKASLTFLPGEGLALAISDTFNVEFDKAKIGTDTSLVIIGIISSFVIMSSVEGIREGTMIAALLVGFTVRMYNRVFPFVDRLFALEGVGCSTRSDMKV